MNTDERIVMLEKKQELIVQYYDKLKEMRIQRNAINRQIKDLESKFNHLIKNQ
jgi:cell division protein FtsB